MDVNNVEFERLNQGLKVFNEFSKMFYDISSSELRKIHLDNFLCSIRSCSDPNIKDISHLVSGDIFSYPGYDFVDKLRNMKNKNSILAKMIDEELEKEPSVIVDWGIYDGKRTSDIFSQIQNRQNILFVLGVDTNARINDSKEKFSILGIDYNPLRIDFNLIRKPLKNNGIKKIHLGLENVFVNCCNAQESLDYGVAKLVDDTISMRDVAFIELFKKLDLGSYEDMFDMFQRYSDELKLDKLLGTSLTYRTAMYQGPESGYKKILFKGERNGRYFEIIIGKTAAINDEKLKSFYSEVRKMGIVNTTYSCRDDCSIIKLERL